MSSAASPGSGSEPEPFEGAAAEPLRALRRALQRADGFTLLIAVCNSPASVCRLIGLLQESMPGVRLHTVALDETTTQPIAEILAQLPDSIDGPVMVTGLERSSPSSAPEHPVLQTLNLSRPEWSKRLPQPVVFWVPEYLLGLLGREAPDFLDWRSDTLYFPEELNREDLVILDSNLWLAAAGRMTERERQARADELRHRLNQPVTREDRVEIESRSTWLTELGTHALFFGERKEAERLFRSALDLRERLQDGKGVALTLGNLAATKLLLGELSEAEKLFTDSLRAARQFHDPASEAQSLLGLGNVAFEKGDPTTATDRYVEAASVQGGTLGAKVYENLALVALKRRDRDQARMYLDKGLEIARTRGDLAELAGLLRMLGALRGMEGDWADAEGLLEESLSVARSLGARDDVATSLAILGVLYLHQRDPSRAREVWTSALEHFTRTGDQRQVEQIRSRLLALPAEAPPPPTGSAAGGS